jgi:hypothetical protein
MGCDIHTFIEMKREITQITENDPSVKTEWVDANLYVKNMYYDPTDPESIETEYVRSSHLTTRNYQLFAVLANVRNYNDLPYIAADRGMPPDASQALIDAYNKDIADAHSLSYITLRELRDWYKKQEANELKNQLLDKPQLHKMFDPWFDFIKNHVAFNFYVYTGNEDFWDNFRITFWFDN